MTYDLAIIGGGPAGAAAAVYAARKRLRTVFVTKDWLGQSNVSERIENWVGTIGISGLDLCKSLEAHAKAYAEGIIDFKEGQLCNQLIKNTDGTFQIMTAQGAYSAKAVLITTGSRRRALDVPGAADFENKGLTYCATCDGPLYSGADVVVVGGGNAGFEAAAQLLAYCKSVTLLSRSEFKADPGTVDKVLSHKNMRAVQFALPTGVKGEKFVTSISYKDRDGAEIELPAAGIFIEIGSIPNTDFAKDLIKLDQFGRIPVDARTQQTLVKGVWAAGDVTDGLYHQNNIAAGDAVRAIEDIYLHVHAK